MKVTLALTIVLSSIVFVSANDEDFVFESFSDISAQIQDVGTNWNAPYQSFIATSGRVFHLVVPKNFIDKNTSKFEAKVHGRNPLPRWLIFDKTNAVFWGVPLDGDLGNIELTVRGLSDEKHATKNIVIDVIPSSRRPSSTKKCSSSEDITLLSLLVDKWTESIKPKQRVVALNNISKFFGIPYSAFTLKPLNQRDDITDSSVILAGPGNENLRNSNSTSIIEVPVGCDGRIFPQYTTLIHQLKQEAKDGTLSEVIRLPIGGWRVKIQNDKAGRQRRQALEQTPEIENGEYDGEYYDDYEEEPGDYEEEIEGSTPVDNLPKVPVTTPNIIPKTSSKINSENTSTHPHRHHHGEAKKDDNMPIWTIVDDNSLGNDNMIPPTSPEVPKTSPTTRGTTTAATTISSTTNTEKSASSTTIKMQFPQTVETYDDNYGNYKTEDYEDEEDEDDLGEDESQTIVPIPKTSGTSTTSTTMTTTTEQFIIEETPLFEDITTIKEAVEKHLDNTDAESSYTTSIPTTIPVLISEIETTIPTTISLITTSSTPSTSVSTTTKTTTPPVTTIKTPTTTTTTITTTTPTTTNPTTTSMPTTITVPAPITTPTTITSTTPSTTSSPITKSTTEILVETEQTTQTKLTTLRHIASTLLPITTISENANEVKNEPPYIENVLKRKNVVAGKIFRFVIPEDTFRDPEDNYDLKLEFLDIDERPITANSWCHFNPHRREIYGLPLDDDHVSKWEYFIRASDKDGASVQDKLTIIVQQHKLERVFNLEFSLEIRIEKKEEFRHYVDWSLKTLRALGRIYNTNMSEITVRKVSYNSQPIIFTWSNDSLPTNYCPKNEIEKLFKILTANDRGDPSRELNNAVTPELRVKKVSYHGLGVCEELNTPIAPPVNYPPILRNPVNRINATIGELLIFRVPKDTFYDPEDLDTLSLNLTLLTGDRQEIPQQNWLQFDSKNREFFGIPRKTSRSEYQLVCVDSGGLPVIDSLEVVVFPAPKVIYNVEFSMTIETAYETFVDNPFIQKKFVDKLMEVFEDGNASHIQFLPFKQKQHSVIVTWFNKTLPTEICPQDQIAKLESMMKNEERGISNRVHAIMEPDFQVSTIKVLPMSNCKVHKPKYHTPKMPDERILIDESSQTISSSDEYLLTFIVPVVVISIMTFFAVLAACILYRRRRTGKMNVLEEGRQSYGNKGIPVIFQEELDEKPEAGTKAPIILKDEKPPLAPPEYSKSGSLKFNDDAEPYHPPPPFTRTQENGKQSRPKPAPTYRKPPPYVPP